MHTVCYCVSGLLCVNSELNDVIFFPFQIDFSSEFMGQSRLNQLHRPPPNVTWNNQSELKVKTKEGLLLSLYT